MEEEQNNTIERESLFIETPDGVVEIKPTDPQYKHFKEIYGKEDKFKIEDLSEFEVLTLRQGLFSFKNSEFFNLSEDEFKQLDNKIKGAFKI